MKPFFSVITINLNNSNGLSRTLHSISKQIFENFEVILIDGGSTDGSLKVWQKYKNLNLKAYSENDEGIYDALNKAINKASGTYIQFLHSGDIFANEQVLLRLYQELNKNKAYAIYGNNYHVTYEDTEPKIKRAWLPGKHYKIKYFYGWMVPHLSCSVNKQLYETFGLFDLHYKIAADYEWQLRVFFRKKITPKYINMDVTFQENGGISNKNLMSIIEANVEVLKAWSKNLGYIPFWIFFLKPLSKILQFRKN